MNKLYAKIFSQFKLWVVSLGGYEQNTINSYLRLVDNFLNYAIAFDKLSLKNIDRDFLYQFASIKKDGGCYSAASLILRLAALNLFYSWAYRIGYANKNLVIEHRKFKLNQKNTKAEKQIYTTTLLTSQEEAKLLAFIPNDFTKIRDKCIVTLILSTAIYAEELFNLKIKDLNLNNSTLKISEGKCRILNLNWAAQKAAQEWFIIRNSVVTDENFDLLFFSRKFTPFSRVLLYKTITEYMKAAEVDASKFGIEVLRQTAICNNINSGKTLEEMKELTGINTLANLEKYYSLLDRI